MIEIIGAHYGNSGRTNGAEKGSRKLKDAVLRKFNVEDGGDIDDFMTSGRHGADCLPEVVTFNTKLRDKVYRSLRAGKKVLTIGGDHSIALGTLSASAKAAGEKGSNFNVIYIDAHGDLNTLSNSPSKNLHGTPLAAFFGFGEPAMTAINEAGANIGRLLLIGTRSLDEGETELIKSQNIRSISSADIINAPERVFYEIDSFLSQTNAEHIHLSFDIDVVDPSEAPGTGVPEKGGITAATATAIIDRLITKYPVRSIDIVEYNSDLDVGEKTLQICKNIVSHIIDRW